MTPATAGEPFAESDFSIASELVSSWSHFRQTALGEWQAFVDPRNGKIGYVEGSVLLAAALVAVVLGIWGFHRRDLHA